MIAKREGFGAILAEGADRAADKLGLPQDAHYYSITTRGMTLPGDDPRGLGFGYGLSFAQGTRGGCDHLRSLCSLRAFRRSVHGPEHQAARLRARRKAHHDCQQARTARRRKPEGYTKSPFPGVLFHHALVIRRAYPRSGRVPERLHRGLDFTEEEFQEIGERIFQLGRAYWTRCMSGAREDTVPERFLKEPMPQGVDYQTNVGVVFPLNDMLQKYYKYRDWDAKTGFPSEKRLKMLGLDYVAKDLAPLRAEVYVRRWKEKTKILLLILISERRYIMAIMTQAQAKKFIDLDDKTLDVLDYLKDKNVVDEKTHRRILLEGYEKLVNYLEKKKVISGKQAKEAVKNGFNYLLPVLAE